MNVRNLLNHDIVCKCGRTHRCDISTLEIGEGVLDKLTYAVEYYKSVLLVADGNTYTICGEHVESLLGSKLRAVCLFETTEPLVPDEAAIAEIETHLNCDVDFILGIGSGVINDLCKYVSFNHGIKSGIIATAPSMDGYASSGAALILGGMKVTHTTHAPDVIIGDVNILKNAPMSMIRSGYGDIIGKYSSLNDWKLSHLIRGEHLCRNIYDIVLQTTEDIRDSVTRIVAREPKAIENLMRALVLIGVTLTLAETTRPGSGSEHHLSHFFEIVGLINHQKHLTHGTDVAYTTILTAFMREQILKSEENDFCEEAADSRMQAWKHIYAFVADEVEKLQEEAGSYREDLKPIYREKWAEIKAILSECPSALECNRMMEAAGLHFSECIETYGEKKICDAMFYGKDLKNRYSVLWLYYAMFSGKSKAVNFQQL
ncbi:MAG: sn-glycerol-1-phosphate dehydrogenase [Clostridia bacterium]|nr:sn-glycerol-1-phosphate dehydrogenase [Clostridia bacterium]